MSGGLQADQARAAARRSPVGGRHGRGCCLAGLLAAALAVACAPAAAPAKPAASEAGGAPATAPATTAPPAAAAPTPTPVPIAVTVGEAATSLTFLQFRLARAKGFDRQNGIEIEFQTISGTPAVQAMIAGGLDFTVSAGAALNARLSGAPTSVLMISVDKSVYSLYAKPDVRSVQDLRGATVGVGAIGDSQYKELGVALGRLGMSLNDLRVVGLPGATQVASAASGAVDGVVLAPPLDVQLDRTGAGFHRLLNLGDYVVGINGGLATAAPLVQSKPAVVDAMVLASLMSFHYLLQERAGTLPVIADYAQVDLETAGRLYDTMRPTFSDGPGRSTPATRAEIVQYAAELLGVAPPANLDEPFDFGPLDRAAARLQTSGWRPN